jgi:hypothetical protein
LFGFIFLELKWCSSYYKYISTSNKEREKAPRRAKGGDGRGGWWRASRNGKNTVHTHTHTQPSLLFRNEILQAKDTALSLSLFRLLLYIFSSLLVCLCVKRD